MHIQNLTEMDTNLWKFPLVYRGLENKEISPEEFLQLLITDIQQNLDSRIRARELSISGDIALASLLEYGNVEAVETSDFIFRSYQQEWLELIASELQSLQDKLQNYKADLPLEFIKELEGDIAAVIDWMNEHRYDCAARLLEKCTNDLNKNIDRVVKGLQTDREWSNLMLEEARNYFQTRIPLSSGIEAETLARQLIQKALTLTLESRQNLDEIEHITKLVRVLCDLQTPNLNLFEQVRELCEEEKVVSSKDDSLEADKKTEVGIQIDRILKERYTPEPSLPKIDPTEWHNRQIYLDVGVDHFLNKPVYVGLLLCTDLALCPEPANEERISWQMREKIQQEIGKHNLVLFDESVDPDKLRYRATLLLRAAKATILSFPTYRPNPEQARKIRDYLINYCLLRSDYLFITQSYEAARDYYREAVSLNPQHLDHNIRVRFPKFAHSIVQNLENLDINRKPEAVTNAIEYWMEEVACQSSNNVLPHMLIREFIFLGNANKWFQQSIENLFEVSSKFSELCLKITKLRRIKVADKSLVIPELNKQFQIEKNRLDNALNKLLDYVDVSHWTDAYELAKQISAFPGLDNTTMQTLNDLKDFTRQALTYSDISNFEDRDNLIRSLERQATQIGERIVNSPTFLARSYLFGYLFRIWQVIRTIHDEAKVVAIPILSFSVAKVHQLIEGKYECHIDVTNMGTTTATQTQLNFTAFDKQKITFEICEPGSLQSLPHHQTKTVLVTAEFTDPTLLIEAIDVDIDFEFIDRERVRHCGKTRIRLDFSSLSEFEPVLQSPYVTGGIVKEEEVFVGREEQINRLLEQVALSPQTNAAIIFGQMRSGKSSLLYHLKKRAPKTVLPVMVSLQSVLADSETQGDLVTTLLEYIANEIVDECYEREISIEELEWGILIQAPGPAIHFERWLRRVKKQVELRPLILFDEFTELISRIDRGLIPPEIMKKFKQLIEQGYFSCVISGIDQMADSFNRFANEFMVSKPEWVGYLEPEAARILIEEPIRLSNGNSRFASNKVVNEIIDLVAGNPYLIQIMCSRIVAYLNQNRVSRITGADLDRVIENFIIETNLGFFHFLCRYREDPDRDSWEAVVEGLFLFLLADETKRTRFTSLDSLSQRAPFVPLQQFEQVANSLESRRVIEAVTTGSTQRYRIVVDLFRRWVLIKRPMDSARLNVFKQRLEQYDAS